MPRRAALAVVAAALSACGAHDPASGLATGTSDALLDYDAFVCDVMPTLVRRCSFPACHGSAEHALRVYSPGKLRLGDPTSRDARDAPLTAEELARNFDSAVGVTRGASAVQRAALDRQAIPLLQKPLAARFGGDEHQGTGIFPTPPHATPEDDPEWLLLENWVAGAAQPRPVRPDCAAFFAALGVAPR